MGVRDTFGDFRTRTKLLLVASFLVGLLLFAGLSLTDLGVNLTLWGWDPKPKWLTQFDAEWFKAHVYIPNILAGLTGFLIGAPVAAVVLTTFTIEREQKVALRSAKRRADAAWSSFRDAVEDLCSDERIWALTDGIEQLDFIETRAFKAVNNYILYLRRDEPNVERYYTLVIGDSDYNVIPSDPEKLFSAMENIAPHFEFAFRAVVDRVKSDDELQILWARVRGSWSVLNQYIRIQFVENSIDWFDATLDNLLLKDMSRNGNPIQGVSDALGDSSPLWVPPINALGALECLQNYVMMNRADLDVMLTIDDTCFGYNSVAFSPYAEDAAKFIIELRQRVEAVEASGWPANAFSA